MPLERSVLGRPWERLRRRRVPFVQQLSAVECGAACLTMVLRYHGCKAPVAEVRDVCGVGRDGVTALSLLRAARSYGLEAKGFSVALEKLPGFATPAILHWRFNHFVVLERCTAKGVVIVDPAAGRRHLSLPCQTHGSGRKK
ncbi:MAG: cysteine peptidase family C39 domain-containing protein, partial [Holophagales bacterium]|nr:cysteine peptidase family C39 domain-containing protein [Holophagales bacterium]